MKIKEAVGKYIVVKPIEKSTVLKTTETATIFKVLSVGEDCEFGKHSKLAERGYYIDDLIIVAQGSVEKCMMLHEEVFYVRESDIVAVVEDGQS